MHILINKRYKVFIFIALLTSFLLNNAFASGASNLGGGIGGGSNGYCVNAQGYAGFCGLAAVSTFDTQYQGYAGNGQIVKVAAPVSLPMPVTPIIQAYDNNYAQSLITCPVDPNPSNTSEYFISNRNSYVGGDRCLASLAPLPTAVMLITSVVWGVPGEISNMANIPQQELNIYKQIEGSVAAAETSAGTTSMGSFLGFSYFEKGCSYLCVIVSTPASAVTQYYIVNIGNANVQNIAYSGESNIQGSSYNISNGYNTQSYIFQQFPSSTQKGVWSWNANFADLSNANLKDLSSTKSINNLIFYTYSMLYVPPYEYYYWFCKYTYDYTVTANINYIHNANVTIPLSKMTQQTTNYGSVGGLNMPYTQTITNGPACTGSVSFGGECPFSSPTCPNLLYRGGTVVTCTGNTGTDGLVINGGKFYLVSTGGGTLNYNGKSYYNLNVYSANAQINGDVCRIYNCRVFYNEIFFYPTNPGPIGANCGGGFRFYYNNKYWCSASSGGGGQTGIPIPIVFGTNIKYYWIAYRICTNFDYSCTYSMGYLTLPQWTNTTIVPYLTYNISLPSTYSDINNQLTFLNNSYDIYSPHNFLDPGNYLDPYPIYTDSQLLFNYNGTLAELPLNFTSFNRSNFNTLSNIPKNTLMTTITSGSAAGLGAGQSFANFQTDGGYLFGSIKNPDFITSSPNDYIYVLNYSYQCGIFCIHKTTNANLYILRLIPNGDFNMTNAQPDTLPSSSSPNYQTSLNNWKMEWETYWNNSLVVQSSNLYIVGGSTLSTVNSGAFGYTTGFWSWLLGSSSAKGTFSFLPTALTTDYSGDLFIEGKQQPTQTLVIGRRSANGDTTENVITTPSGYQASNEFTASPGGQYLFLANIKYGNISIFNGANLTYTGNISLSYSTPQNNLNIAAYLAKGGPYGSATVAGTYYTSKAVNDIAAYHHPISIFESDGVLYVLDNWSFTVTTSDGQVENSKMLVLRAFSGNGIEIPIDSFNINDLLGTTTGAAPSGAELSGINFPPYGWVISANISVGNNKYITYCAVGGSNGCTYTPLTLPVHAGISTYPQASIRGNNGYQPIGPLVFNVNPNIGQIGPSVSTNLGETNITMSSNYNNTAYLTANVLPITGYDIPGGGLPESAWKELLVLNLNVFNYTKVQNMQNDSYICYISQNSSAYPDSPCVEPRTGTDLQNLLNNITGPILGIPSPIGYIEGQGSPQRFLNLPNIISLLIPTNIQGNSAQNSANAQSTTSNGCATIYGKQQCLTTSEQSILSQANPSTKQAASSIQREYLNSTIQGYFLVPYNISYTLKQQWSPSTLTGQPEGDPPPVGSAACIYNFPSDPNTQTTVTFGYQGITPTSSNLNESIEGGPIYLQSISSSKQLYIPNVSDIGLFVTPNFGYNLLSDRLFGEIYINQSVGPQGNHLFNIIPQVINQSHIFNYILNTFVQVGAILPTGVQSVAAYETETAVPITPPTVNQQSITGYFLPSYYSGNNKLTYSNSPINGNDISLPELFSTFQKENYIYNLTLNLTGNNNILGYNRLVYVFVDRFNNYIFTPIDMDIGNVTTITIQNSTSVNALNPNETSITINGIAGYYSNIFDNNPSPLPAGSNIYLYYQKNINYYSSSTFGLLSALAQYNQLCAFGNNPSQCALANPLNATQTVLSFGSPQYNTVTFHTQYNSINACSPEPDSLISTNYINSLKECNIYGSYGLPMTGVTAQGNTEYCVPNFANGTGTLTSQLGLIGITQTNSIGAFSYQFNICGTGEGSVIAQYYGAPYPQPQPFEQQNLANTQTFGTAINPSLIGFPSEEYSYTYFPNESVSEFPVGNFVLAFGDIELPLMIIIAMAIIVVTYKLEVNRSVNMKKRK